MKSLISGKFLPSLLLAFMVAPSLTRAADLDEDGLDDAVEQTLLDRHRPVLVFEDDERHWPVSASRFVRNSRLRWNTHPDRKFEYPWLVDVYSEAELASNPRLIFEGAARRPGDPRYSASTVAIHTSRNEWYFDINDNARDGVFPGASGAFHEGMYGHVVRLADGRILLQYWQLFPHNEAECVSDCGDHEGDWLWIDLFLEGSTPYTLQEIVYHHHGDGNCPPTRLPFAGGRVGQNIIPPIPLPADGVPTCYVEEQAHEWWPWSSGGEECEFDPTHLGLCFNASHQGNGVSYRVAHVENIGEQFAPMPGNLDAELILIYNGRWGGWGSECDDHWFEPADSPMYHGGIGFPMPAKRSRVYVDPQGVAVNPGSGSRYRPTNNLLSGQDKLFPGGVMSVRPAAYAFPVTLSVPMTIEAWP